MRIGHDLATDGLNRILEHDPGDLTCTVEAGVRLSALRATLAASGQRLSLDPPGTRRSARSSRETSSGPLRHRFGAPRDLVLGVTLVLADGTVANAGGKVVKNVAGYDLARLVCGSDGRLALIARACFRLHPLPKASSTLVVETDDTAAVALATRRLAAPAERARRPPPRPGGRALRRVGSGRGGAARECEGARRRRRGGRFRVGRVDEAARPLRAGEPVSRRATSRHSSTDSTRPWSESRRASPTSRTTSQVETSEPPRSSGGSGVSSTRRGSSRA